MSHEKIFLASSDGKQPTMIMQVFLPSLPLFNFL